MLLASCFAWECWPFRPWKFLAFDIGLSCSTTFVHGVFIVSRLLRWSLFFFFESEISAYLRFVVYACFSFSVFCMENALVFVYKLLKKKKKGSLGLPACDLLHSIFRDDFPNLSSNAIWLKAKRLGESDKGNTSNNSGRKKARRLSSSPKLVPRLTSPAAESSSTLKKRISRLQEKLSSHREMLKRREAAIQGFRNDFLSPFRSVQPSPNSNCPFPTITHTTSTLTPIMTTPPFIPVMFPFLAPPTSQPIQKVKTYDLKTNISILFNVVSFFPPLLTFLNNN